jgi:hypothetical protein
LKNNFFDVEILEKNENPPISLSKNGEISPGKKN